MAAPVHPPPTAGWVEHGLPVSVLLGWSNTGSMGQPHQLLGVGEAAMETAQQQATGATGNRCQTRAQVARLHVLPRYRPTLATVTTTNKGTGQWLQTTSHQSQLAGPQSRWAPSQASVCPHSTWNSQQAGNRNSAADPRPCDRREQPRLHRTPNCESTPYSAQLLLSGSPVSLFLSYFSAFAHSVPSVKTALPCIFILATSTDSKARLPGHPCDHDQVNHPSSAPWLPF